MKVTIVLDTDDPVGLDDAFKVAQLLHTRHSGYGITKVTLDKIRLIKVLRNFVRTGRDYEAENPDKSMTDLKYVKNFVDLLIDEQNRRS